MLIEPLDPSGYAPIQKFVPSVVGKIASAPSEDLLANSIQLT